MSGGDTEQIGVLENCAVVVLGVAAWIGIVRYGLFDTRVVVSRALVYGALTLVVVGGLRRRGRGRRAVRARPRAAGGRDRGRGARRATAARRPATTGQPPGVRAPRRAGGRDGAARRAPRRGRGAARGVGSGRAYGRRGAATVLCGRRGGRRLVASRGACGPEAVREIWLPFAGETIGRLTCADPARRLLPLRRGAARRPRPAGGAAVHAVRLTDALRHSRERLVRRARRSAAGCAATCTTGSVPTLAGIALGIDTAGGRPPPRGRGPAARQLARGGSRPRSTISAGSSTTCARRCSTSSDLVGAVREQAARRSAARPSRCPSRCRRCRRRWRWPRTGSRSRRSPTPTGTRPARRCRCRCR